MQKTSIIYSLESFEFKELIEKSNSLAQVLRSLGYSSHSSGNYRTLHKRIKEEGLCIEHMREHHRNFCKTHLKSLTKAIPLEKILVNYSNYDTGKLKRRLLAAGLLEEKCYECGNGSLWNGKKIVLQLDHINGNAHDNRLINLRLLCPNCHSQTDTYCGKSNRRYNKKKQREKTRICKAENCSKLITFGSTTGFCNSCVRKGPDNHNTKVLNRPSKQELTKLILEKPFLQIGNDYGVSDNAIRRWCVAYDLPRTKRDIEAQREQLEQSIKQEAILT